MRPLGPPRMPSSIVAPHQLQNASIDSRGVDVPRGVGRETGDVRSSLRSPRPGGGRGQGPAGVLPDGIAQRRPRPHVPRGHVSGGVPRQNDVGMLRGTHQRPGLGGNGAPEGVQRETQGLGPVPPVVAAEAAEGPVGASRPDQGVLRPDETEHGSSGQGNGAEAAEGGRGDGRVGKDRGEEAEGAVFAAHQEDGAAGEEGEDGASARGSDATVGLGPRVQKKEGAVARRSVEGVSFLLRVLLIERRLLRDLVVFRGGGGGRVVVVVVAVAVVVRRGSSVPCRERGVGASGSFAWEKPERSRIWRSEKTVGTLMHRVGRRGAGGSTS
mmetsp:Transcript_18374/g.42055  ORF Transcript_18374/g.42055 Transcript_18374/m.42055 type:complete len:326 (-) Transcript_18374:978-1955(-)